MGNRRIFIKQCLALYLTGQGYLIGCNRPEKSPVDPCLDLSYLTPSELATREQLGYTDESSFSERTCANCQLFVKSDQSKSCGSCLVMKGPVSDEGYCTVWGPITMQ